MDCFGGLGGGGFEEDDEAEGDDILIVIETACLVELKSLSANNRERKSSMIKWKGWDDFGRLA